MQASIQTIGEKKLVGKRSIMTFANNTTIELWRGFMPKRKEIKNTLGANLYSIQIYPPLFFTAVKLDVPFEKWATMEVSDFSAIPDEMETYTLPGGLYAVFFYKGLNTDTLIFEYIHRTWLPNSDYLLDNRPHFEILGEKYRNADPNSEEEIWIPIQLKK
jgi:AraC family transcriptional regulator